MAPSAARRALRPLIQALSRESNPIPLKHALSSLGWMADEVRLPLCTAGAETRAAVTAVLAEREDLATPGLTEEAAAVFGTYL